MRHLSIVYTINDEDSFAKELQRINKYIGPSKDKKWAITSMVIGHQHDRLNDIWDVIDNDSHITKTAQLNAIEDILNKDTY